MRTLRLTVAVLMAGLLAGCSNGDDAAKDDDRPAEPRSTTTTAPPLVAAPLTGALVSPDVAGRPAVIVKIDNSKDGRPQAGLDKADVVFEERVEGGVTRFVTVFHSQDTDLAGPIRSLRSTDPDIVAAFGGVFAFSDAVPSVLRLLKDVPVTPVYEMQGGAAFTYPAGRKRPYKTFAATARLRQEAADGAKAPPPLARFTAAGEAPPAGDGPATSATVTFGTRTTATVDWDAAAGRWLRSTSGTPHTLQDGSRLGFTSVIIQPVPYRSAGYKDISGSVVDEAVVVGSGTATLLVNGQQKAIRWSKPDARTMTAFTDAAGQPLVLPPGPVLILLPPSAAPVAIT